MPQSFSSNYQHIIFSTKDRHLFLKSPDHQQKLYPYLAGITKNLTCHPIKIGGHTDHIHLFISFSRTKHLTDYIGELKRASSIWAKTEIHPDFNWQSGYAAFSVSLSNAKTVATYIENQEQHHQTATFKQEYIKFLETHNIPYDQKYMWD